MTELQLDGESEPIGAPVKTHSYSVRKRGRNAKRRSIGSTAIVHDETHSDLYKQVTKYLKRKGLDFSGSCTVTDFPRYGANDIQRTFGQVEVKVGEESNKYLALIGKLDTITRRIGHRVEKVNGHYLSINTQPINGTFHTVFITPKDGLDLSR